MFGYSVSLRTIPGESISSTRASRLVDALKERIRLADSIEIETFGVDEESDSVLKLLRRMLQEFRSGELSKQEYEAICTSADVSPYEAGIEMRAEQIRKRVLKNGELFADCRMPRSEAKAESVFSDLVAFAKEHSLMLIGSNAKAVDLKRPGTLPPDWHEAFAPPFALPGFFISFNPPYETLHWAGGEHAIDGSDCPNCSMPLMQYLSLDTRDTQLGLSSLNAQTIPLLWCLRCCICEDEFVYQIINDRRIQILRYEEGVDHWRADWDELIGGDIIPRRELQLISIPRRAQELFDTMNRWNPLPEDKVTDEELRELGNILEQFDDPMIARGNRGVINQVGGRPFLNQGFFPPHCPTCKDRGDAKRRMLLLTVLTEDRFAKVKFTYHCIYVLFFICTECSTVQVEHYL